MLQHDVAVDVQEELGLIARRDLRFPPNRLRGLKMGHPDPGGQRPKPAGADDLVHRVGRVVV
jgi:hypothetical protein